MAECKHDVLEAPAVQVKEPDPNVSSSTPGNVPWAFSITSTDTPFTFEYHMGRTYVCKKCGKKFVIQNMYEIE